jgi:hypothetical protein
MNKGTNNIKQVLIRLGEIDDGIFDWMIVLDQKRKQKDTGDKNFTHPNVSQNIDIQSPSAPHLHIHSISSPVSNVGVYSSPNRPDTKPLAENRQNKPKPIEKSPKHVPPERQPNPAPPVEPKKKIGWWGRLFFCCQKDFE